MSYFEARGDSNKQPLQVLNWPSAWHLGFPRLTQEASAQADGTAPVIMLQPFPSCCLSKPVVENACGFGQQWNIAYPSNVSQARLRTTEGESLIEQADAIAPSFDVLAASQGPVTTGADFGADDP
jgi:hypothetical protein